MTKRKEPKSVEDTGLLKPHEVAEMFRVDARTVARWAKTGKLTSIRTLGNQRRFSRSQVEELLKGDG